MYQFPSLSLLGHPPSAIFSNFPHSGVGADLPYQSHQDLKHVQGCFHLIFLKVRLAFCLDVLLITEKAFPILLCLKCLIQAFCGTRSITFSTASSVSPGVSNRHSVYQRVMVGQLSPKPTVEAKAIITLYQLLSRVRNSPVNEQIFFLHLQVFFTAHSKAGVELICFQLQTFVHYPRLISRVKNKHLLH